MNELLWDLVFPRRAPLLPVLVPLLMLSSCMVVLGVLASMTRTRRRQTGTKRR